MKRRIPFVLTVAAATISACGSSNGSGTGGSGGHGANPPSCENPLPAEGSACFNESEPFNSCWFPDPCGGAQQVFAECDVHAGTWHRSVNGCGCPASEPIPGSACSLPADEWCSYHPASCCPDEVRCVDGKWVSSCEPACGE